MIAIISLARAGSVRIPGKNWKPFLGKPLFEWTAETMRQLQNNTNIFHLYVMTDAQPIKNIAKNYNINIIDEPSYLSGNVHGGNESFRYIHNHLNGKYDTYILLQPTSPIRNLNLIRKWIVNFSKSNKNSGFSAMKVDKYCYNNTGPINFNYNNRTCDGTAETQVYIENGSFYIFKKEILNKKHIIDYNSYIIFEDDKIIDLDTFQDWKRAENEYKNNT